MDDTKTLLTVAEAAGRLRVGRSFFYILLMRGKIGSVKVGKCRRIPPGEIDRYVESLVREQSVLGEKLDTVRDGEGAA